jgi:hypothetical protein
MSRIATWSRLAGIAGITATLFGASPSASFAQWPPLSMPQASPGASVAQTVGVTEIEIDYARPQVRGRKVWGELVPYGQVWRAGANTNTRITFSTPVVVGGKSLPAGTYGLHMIPTTGEWTVIFSRDADRWGSFGYDEKADALRITATPTEGPMTESLAYSFDKVTNDSAEVALNWEKLRVAFPVEVDFKALTVEGLRRDLTGLAQFFWQPWNTAANWCAQNQVNLDEAMTWVERSIAMNSNFINNKTKARLLRLAGDDAGADAIVAKAIVSATEQEMNLHGYELLGEGKNDEAIAVFRRNVKDHPESWNVHDSLGEGLAAAGKTAEAIAAYRKALAMAPEAQKARIEGILAGLAAKR